MSQSDLKNIEEFIVDDVKSNLDDSDNNEITGLDDEPKSDMIKIISNDGYVCCIERKYTLISEFLKGITNDFFIIKSLLADLKK